MTPKQVIALASKHAESASDMQSSAKVCLADARRHFANSDYGYAKLAALKSLRYSVGIFHPDYQRAEGIGIFSAEHQHATKGTEA